MKLCEIASPQQFTNWSEPDDLALRKDYEEYSNEIKWRDRAELMGFRYPLFDDIHQYEHDVHNAAVINVTTSFDRQIHNRTHMTTIGTKRDQIRIIDGFKHNDPIPYPVIIQGARGYWIMSGNTRLDVANILGVQAKAKLVDLRMNKKSGGDLDTRLR